MYVCASVDHLAALLSVREFLTSKKKIIAINKYFKIKHWPGACKYERGRFHKEINYSRINKLQIN